LLLTQEGPAFRKLWPGLKRCDDLTRQPCIPDHLSGEVWRAEFPAGSDISGCSSCLQPLLAYQADLVWDRRPSSINGSLWHEVGVRHSGGLLARHARCIEVVHWAGRHDSRHNMQASHNRAKFSTLHFLLCIRYISGHIHRTAVA
jgi:hypothetical protein